MAEARRQMESLAAQFPVPAGTTRSSVLIGGVPCEWIDPPAPATDRCVVYLHGGAYCQGSLSTHRGLGTRLALATSVRVLMVDYRLAPEFPFPAALDDVTNVCAALRAARPGLRFVLAGDSAGGGLVVSACFRMRAASEPMPAALLLVCPWLDLEMAAPEGAEDPIRDPTKSRAGLRKLAQLYCGPHDPRDPLVSPLRGEPAGLPPTCLLAAEHDVVGPEALQFCQRARGQGVAVECRVGHDMLHVWPLFAGYLPEADEAVEEMARFTRRQLALHTA